MQVPDYNVIVPPQIYDKQQDHISTLFRNFAQDQILSQKRPMTGREILDNLLPINSTLHKQIKNKCEDYPRIILSQSKSGLFKKFKKKEPIPGIDRRTIFYGLCSELYDPNEWVSLGDNKISKSFVDTKPADVEPSLLPTIALTDFPDLTIDTPTQFPTQEVKNAWEVLLQNVPSNHNVWKSIFDAISDINHNAAFVQDSSFVKEFLSHNPILNDSMYLTQILKVLQNEFEFRLKLFH